MKNEISVDNALKRYYFANNVVITVGAVVFVLGLLFASNYFSVGNGIIIGALASLVFGALISLVYMVLSKVWIFLAFKCVDNVHELKKRLILLCETTEENALFKKIQNSTEYDRKYGELRYKFAQKDVFIDDKEIPDETVFYYSKKLTLLVLIFLLPVVAFGILILIFAVFEKEYKVVIFGVFFLILATWGYYVGYKRLKNRKPQLILNSKGITTDKAGFHKWEEIENCGIITGNRASLGYHHYKEYVNIKLAYLDVRNNGIELSKLLMVYAERNKLQISKSSN